MPISPSVVRAMTMEASPCHTRRSTETRSTCNSATTTPQQVQLVREKASAFELAGLALDVLDATTHEERLLGEVVVLALGQRLERGEGLLERDERALEAGEGLRDEGVLGQEPLDPARALDQDLVLLRQLVDAQDGDDVLEVLVALED